MIGLFGSSVRKRLDKLYIAGLVSKTKSSGEALSTIFASVAIVAVEAKISNLNAAVRQAFPKHLVRICILMSSFLARELSPELKSQHLLTASVY